jgi:hypothetical protein
MKFNFRKIASVLASAVMLGSTIGIAAAANYPAPFVSNAGGDVAVVVGSSAATSDFIAAADLGANLQAELAKLTAVGGSSSGASVAGGDSVSLATSSRNLYYGDALNVARSSISSSELPSVLADGKVVDLKGTEYSYTQTIMPGQVNSTFSTDNGNSNDPVLNFPISTSAQTAQMYNYTFSFSKNLNVSDNVNVQGQKIKILGVDYVIGASSTNSTLYLYGAGETVTLNGAETKTVTIAGTEHTVQLTAATAATTAKITVDGISKSVTTGSSYSFAGDLNVYIKDITYQGYAGGAQSAELIVGANTLLLQNGATVKQGADQTTIKGSWATISAAGVGIISGFTTSVAMPTAQKDALLKGVPVTDPIFGGLSVNLVGAVPDLNDSSKSLVKVSTDNNQFAFVTFTSARAGSTGQQQITYAYDNITSSSTVQPLLAHQTLNTNKGRIHVAEGEASSLYDWIVVNQGDAGTILSVDDISVDSGTSGTVTLSDAITGESQKITLTNTSGIYTKSGVNVFGGNGYVVNIVDPTVAALQINMTWDGTTATTLFPRIKLRDGGWLAFLTQTTVANGTLVILPDGATTITTTGTNLSTTAIQNGIVWGSNQSTPSTIVWNITGGGANCVFTNNTGPAILIIEPKKWNDGTYGDYICVPMSTTGATEIAIGTPTLNGTDSGFQSYGSDTYKSAAVDQFGAFVTYESRTNENGVATITMPTSQMYLDVLFTAVGATVTPGSSGSGSVTELGSVTVKDTDVSQVSSKNLIVVGGSCINEAAQKVLGESAASCGADFTTATGVGADQALIKVVANPYLAADTMKIAMLVAGYEAADTTKAVKYLTTAKASTAVGVTKLSTSGTVATVVTSA